MNRRASLGAALAGLAIPLALTGAAHAEKVDIPVPKAAVVTGINAALNGTRIHVHNLGSRHGMSWLDQQSYVLSPSGKRSPFDVEEYAYQVTRFGRHLMYYVRDFNSSSLRAYADGSQLRLVIEFESQGEEIAAKCVHRRGVGKNRHWEECSLGIERDIHLNNALVEVALTPAVYDNSIAYASPSASFKADIKIANKMCGIAKGICSWIEGKIKSKLYPRIEQAVTAKLNDSEMKQQVANGVRNALKGFVDPAWKVTGVRSQGDKFIISVERPDQIDGQSVRMVSVQAKSSQTMTCPGNVPLTATINTKYAMKGTGWFEHEDGRKSPVFNWQTNKPGTVVSPASRNFKGKAGQSFNNLSTKIVVKWKGVDGKTYTKTSSPAKYAVKCTHSAAGGIKMK